MEDVMKVNVDENFSMSFLTANVIYKAGDKNGGDALALYIRYIQQSKWQRTNQPYCNDEYMIKWLGRGKTKFYKIKKILTDLWLIKTIRDNTDEKTYIKVYYLVSGEKTEALIKQELASPFYTKMESQVQNLKNGEVFATENTYTESETPDKNLNNWEVFATENRCIENRYTENRYTENGTQMLKVININALSNKDKCFPEFSNETSEQFADANSSELSNQFMFNDDSIEFYANSVMQQTRLEDKLEILWKQFPHLPGYKGSKKKCLTQLKKMKLDYDFVYGLIYDMRLLKYQVDYNIVKWQGFMEQFLETYSPLSEKERDKQLYKIVEYIKRHNQDKTLFQERARDLINFLGYEKYHSVFRAVPNNREDCVDLTKIS